jgi:uncharacterized protein (DUF697 family)
MASTARYPSASATDATNRAEKAIRAATLAAAGLGIPGLLHPGIDEAGMAAIWLTMVTAIAKDCNAKISPATAGKMVTAAVSSVAAYTLGSKILTWAAMPVLIAFPVAGIPAAVALNSVLNAVFTYRLGKECVSRFSNPAFTSRDLIDIGRHLAALPNFTEISDIKRILSGA